MSRQISCGFKNLDKLGVRIKKPKTPKWSFKWINELKPFINIGAVFHQTRPVGLAVMCEHWTPKGDCKVTGNKERN